MLRSGSTFIAYSPAGKRCLVLIKPVLQGHYWECQVWRASDRGFSQTGTIERWTAEDITAMQASNQAMRE